MPEGTKVHHVYEALLREGHSKESAAKIAQSQTDEALATGEPPKHKNSIAFQNGCTRGREYLKSKFGES